MLTIVIPSTVIASQTNAKDYLVQNLVTEGEGLYEDSYIQGRYIYRGQNPDNYIEFNDELWRVISVEKDGTIKIIRTTSIDNQTFDETNHRDKGSQGKGGTRDFDSFKTTKSYKPLKNGYFFVNLLFFILRTLSYFDIMYIQGSDKHAYKKN